MNLGGETSPLRAELRDEAKRAAACLLIDLALSTEGTQEKAARRLGVSHRTFKRALADRRDLAWLVPLPDWRGE